MKINCILTGFSVVDHILPPSLSSFPLLCYLLHCHLSFAAPSNQQAQGHEVGKCLLSVFLSPRSSQLWFKPCCAGPRWKSQEWHRAALNTGCHCCSWGCGKEKFGISSKLKSVPVRNVLGRLWKYLGGSVADNCFLLNKRKKRTFAPSQSRHNGGRASPEGSIFSRHQPAQLIAFPSSAPSRSVEKGRRVFVCVCAPRDAVSSAGLGEELWSGCWGCQTQPTCRGTVFQMTQG